MSVIINTEHFSISPHTRETVEGILEKLNSVLSEGSSVRLYLKKEPKDQLTAVLKVHTQGKDYVATEMGPDLEALVIKMEGHLHRRLVDTNQKRIHQRKRSAS